MVPMNYLLLAGAALIWGSQYILTKIALTSFSTTMIAAGRVGIGAIVLTLLVALPIESSSSLQSKRSFWNCLPDFILIGFLEATVPCVFVAWAQTRLASSVTAILIGTVPLFATLLEALFVKRKMISLRKSMALFLGFLGIVILVGPEFCSSPGRVTSNDSSLLFPVSSRSFAAIFSSYF